MKRAVFSAVSAGVVSAMLLVAMAPCPGVYYDIMRWTLFLVSGWIVFQWLYDLPLPALLKASPVLFGVLVIALLFNPIARIHGARPFWMKMDAVGTVVFAFAAYVSFAFRHSAENEENNEHE